MCNEFCGGLALSRCSQQIQADRLAATEAIRRQRLLSGGVSSRYEATFAVDPARSARVGDRSVPGRWARRGRRLVFASALFGTTLTAQALVPVAAIPDDGNRGESSGDSSDGGSNDSGSDSGNDSGSDSGNDSGSDSGNDSGSAGGGLGGGADDRDNTSTGPANSPDGDGGTAAGNNAAGDGGNSEGDDAQSGAGSLDGLGGEPDGLDDYNDDLSAFGGNGDVGPSAGSPGAEASNDGPGSSPDPTDDSNGSSTFGGNGDVGPSAGSPGAEASNDGPGSSPDPVSTEPDGLDVYGEDMSDLGSADLSQPTPGSPGAESSDDGPFSSPESAPTPGQTGDVTYDPETTADMAQNPSGMVVDNVETMGPGAQAGGRIPGAAPGGIQVNVNAGTTEQNTSAQAVTTFPNADGSHDVMVQDSTGSASMTGIDVSVSGGNMGVQVGVAAGVVHSTEVDIDRVTVPAESIDSETGALPQTDDLDNLEPGVTVVDIDIEQTDEDGAGVYGGASAQVEPGVSTNGSSQGRPGSSNGGSAQTGPAAGGQRPDGGHFEAGAQAGVEVAADTTPISGDITTVQSNEDGTTQVTNTEFTGQHTEAGAEVTVGVEGSMQTPSVDGAPAPTASGELGAAGELSVQVTSGETQSVSQTHPTGSPTITDQAENGNLSLGPNGNYDVSTGSFTVTDTVALGGVAAGGTIGGEQQAANGSGPNSVSSSAEVSFEVQTVDRDVVSQQTTDHMTTPAGNGDTGQTPDDGHVNATTESTNVANDNSHTISSQEVSLPGDPAIWSDDGNDALSSNTVATNNSVVEGTNNEMTDLAQDTAANDPSAAGNGYVNDIAGGATPAEAAQNNPPGVVSAGADAMANQQAAQQNDQQAAENDAQHGGDTEDGAADSSVGSTPDPVGGGAPAPDDAPVGPSEDDQGLSDAEINDVGNGDYGEEDFSFPSADEPEPGPEVSAGDASDVDDVGPDVSGDQSPAEVTIEEVSTEPSSITVDDQPASDSGPDSLGPEDVDVDVVEVTTPSLFDDDDDDEPEGPGADAPPPEPVDDQRFPICESADSDPDGDGWGWENDATCVVTEAPTPVNDPAPDPADADDSADADAGWQNVSTPESVTVWDSPFESSTDAQGRPWCESDWSDSDGDGWGWENDATCVVRT